MRDEIPDQPGPPPPQGRRHAAGADPGKRCQILEGAAREFFEKGYDAASMNGICKAAGVSKGTLYVYFENKEDLFVALVENRRAEFFESLTQALAGAGTVEGRLLTYARALLRKLTSEEVIQLQRIVIGVGTRVPTLGARFYEAGATYFLGRLGTFLQAEIDAGTLRIEDVHRAGTQFVELISSEIWRARLFAHRPAPPGPEEIEALAQDGVRDFLKLYRA
ncbi:TetR/AcrR family transcriptional regulator [Pseudooceanicola sp. CBS1P-1]|uniref:TetR family transcriptional regulator n=1 Tax=Pseudooceanicola albus TaxID=2692189 RepID=A0A6L7G9V7_9RHOB|nr:MULTISPECIES: TetR/AcrR family transcriptional regulator [Pseudooceanicola]MBT9386046.1 TetR/AcrR family transcriptional regulator [Pseudooceanicola endophyticus]MXN19533.1 TetR family transcriptional regulator [Pseudooceanicola albus]